MRFWYVVEERCRIKEDGTLGVPISAEIVDIIPRIGTGCCEWNDVEHKDGDIYVCRKWIRTKQEAEEEIKFWMSH